MFPRLGAHLYLWHEQVTTALLLEDLERCARLGLSFLEIPLGDNIAFEAEPLGAAAKAAGIHLVISPGGDWPAECDLSLPGDAGLRWHRQQLETGAACGAIAYTGALYGHPGTILYEPHTAADEQRVGDGLAALAEHAAAYEMTLAIEPMSHFRTHIANTPAEAMHLINLAGAPPNLHLLFDTYHLCTEISSYREALETAMPRLWGLHACENNRGVPGSGFLPWEEIITTLKAHDWRGYLGFESYNSSCRQGHFAISRGMFHNVCPDGDSFVAQGTHFLTQLWTQTRISP